MSVAAAETSALVVFGLGAEEFAAPVAQVREVLPLAGMTRVPRAAPEVHGVMNVRGQILPVIDLRRRLGFPPREPGGAAYVLIHLAPGAGAVGLIVDEVREVLRVPAAQVEEPPAMLMTESARHYLLGVAKVEDRLILVCDLAAMVRGGP